MTSPISGPGAPFPTGGTNQEKINTALLHSPFAKMLGPTATPQQIQQAINMVLKASIDQIKKDQQAAVEAIRKARKVIEGEDVNE